MSDAGHPGILDLLQPEILEQGGGGRRVIFAEAEMVDQEGRLIAKGRQNGVPIGE